VAEENKHLPESPLPTVNTPRSVVDGVVQWKEEELHPEVEPEPEAETAASNETGEAPAPSAEVPGTKG
jgi:hypothetical protein